MDAHRRDGLVQRQLQRQLSYDHRHDHRLGEREGFLYGGRPLRLGRQGAAIRNVGVINAAIYNKTTTDPSVGLLAAGISENSIVESCWATGTIYSDTTSPYYSYVGGLVGSIGIKSLICNSWTNVVVYAKGSSDSFVGGIVGDTGATTPPL